MLFRSVKVSYRDGLRPGEDAITVAYPSVLRFELKDGETLLGSVLLVHHQVDRYDKKAEETLRIVVDQWQMILRYAKSLWEIDRIKADFTSMILHDLRSPLAVVKAYGEILRDGLAGPIETRQKEFVGRILSSTEKILALLNDVLDVSKIEAGKLEIAPETVDLRPLLNRVVADFSILAQDKNVQLMSEIHPGLPAAGVDPGRLEQVLNNLFSNAIKFTPGKGRIVLKAGPAGQPDWILIEVTDDGPGISPEETQKLFRKYEQAKAGQSSKTKGTGLGLVICKMIIEAHGGKIGLSSSVGRGSTFWFTVPAAVGGEAQA